MKKSIFFFIMGTVCLALFFTACRKGEKQDVVPIVSDSKPANPLNPYDSFGYWHNVILDSIQAGRAKVRISDFKSSCDIIRGFYKMKGWQDLSSAHFDFVPQLVNDATFDMPQLIGRSGWSDSVKTQLGGLMANLQSLSVDSCSFPDVKRIIMDFENGVLHSGLPVDDRKVILKIASLARFSAYRWLSHAGSLQLFDPALLLKVHELRGSSVSVVMNAKSRLLRRSLLKRIGKWFAVSAIDISSAIADLSVASGAGASDFMSVLLDLN